MIALRQLRRDLMSQKLRTGLTVFGIVWGTTAVSLLLAFGQGFHHQMIKSSRGLGGDIVIAWPSRTSMVFEGMGTGRRIALTERDIELLRTRSILLGDISAEYAESLKLQHGRRVLAVDVVGVEPSFGDMRNVIAAEGGRFLNPLDESLRRRVAFLGNDLSEDLFGSSDPVGQEIRVHGSPFVIVGVMRPKIQNSNYTGSDKGKLFIPASTFRALTGQKHLDDFIFRATGVVGTDACIREVRSILAGRHGFDPEDAEALQVWDTTEMRKFLETFMLAFRGLLGILGALTLVVGGIGVSNIMNVVVEERTREIGVKMALGARPASILRQFLAETLVITGLGGAVGLSLTAAVCAAIPAGAEEMIGRPALSPSVSLLTAALLGCIGLAAGYFPARTASRLDPVVAMKV